MLHSVFNYFPVLAQATSSAFTAADAGQVGFTAIQANPQGLPGAGVAITIVGGIMFFSLLFTIVGVILSAGLWAVGAFSNNYTQSVNGKKGFLICAAAALAIGAAYFMVRFFFGAGNAIGGGS